MATEIELEQDLPQDRYFDIDGLARYSGLSVKTLRRLMDDPLRPLPNHHIHAAGRDRGRILVAKREFDAWVAAFPPLRSKIRPAKVEEPGGPPVWGRRVVSK